MGDNEYIGEFMPEPKTYADKKDVLADMVEKKTFRHIYGPSYFPLICLGISDSMMTLSLEKTLMH